MLCDEQRAALERLFEIAIEHDSGGARRVADFLLAWWNARENGGFDFADLWYLDSSIRSDILLVITFIASNQTYLEDEFGEKFKRVHAAWRAAAVK